MKRMLPIITACLLVVLLVVSVRASGPVSPDVRPGECAPGVQYTQRFQFLPSSWDVNEYLKYITEYQGCDVHISEGFEEGTQRHGFYIWYRLPPLTQK